MFSSTSELGGVGGGIVNRVKHFSDLLTVPRWCFFCGPFLLFMFHVYLLYSLQPYDRMLGKGWSLGFLLLRTAALATGMGGLNAFYWYQTFILDYIFVKGQDKGSAGMEASYL